MLLSFYINIILKILIKVKYWCPGVESDHRVGDFQSPAFPFGYLGMDNAPGLEPAKSGATIQRVYLSTTRYMVPRIGIEPKTHGLEGRCSTPLN